MHQNLKINIPRERALQTDFVWREAQLSIKSVWFLVKHIYLIIQNTKSKELIAIYLSTTTLNEKNPRNLGPPIPHILAGKLFSISKQSSVLSLQTAKGFIYEKKRTGKRVLQDMSSGWIFHISISISNKTFFENFAQQLVLTKIKENIKLHMTGSTEFPAQSACNAEIACMP